jgi:signal transduction histidine kinase
VVSRLFRAGDGSDGEHGELALEAARGRALVEASREPLVVLDGDRRVLTASPSAREILGGIVEGELFPANAVDGHGIFEVPYEVLGRAETLVYLGASVGGTRYEELRVGFTAAVSHELRTPLARLLALLESASLPGANAAEIVDHALAEVASMGELIDDVLFLSELETGREIVSLAATPASPLLRETVERLGDSADRAGVRLVVTASDDAVVPLRPRMLRVLAENLTMNAIRYAGPGATFTLAAHMEGGAALLEARDDGTGIDEADLPRLFERFYRGDRARSSRGTGLGLSIVKHIVTSAGGSVEAQGGRGSGLAIRCLFPGP